MTLKECYEKMNGNYDLALSCIRKEDRLASIVLLFYENNLNLDLKNALDQGDAETAFRHAHTMKGLCSTLGLTNLTNAAVELTENLRGRSFTSETNALAEKVFIEYKIVLDTIKEFSESIEK